MSRKLNDVEFFETFIGPCQHLGYRVFQAPGQRPYFRCMLHVTHGNIVYRCSAGRPLTDKEIQERS